MALVAALLWVYTSSMWTAIEMVIKINGWCHTTGLLEFDTTEKTMVLAKRCFGWFVCWAGGFSVSYWGYGFLYLAIMWCPWSDIGEIGWCICFDWRVDCIGFESHRWGLFGLTSQYASSASSLNNIFPI